MAAPKGKDLGSVVRWHDEDVMCSKGERNVTPREPNIKFIKELGEY